MRLIAISVAWVLGISLARPFPSIETAIWVVFLATAMCFAIVWRRQYRLRWFAALLAAFAAGGARQSLLPRTSEIAAYNGYSGTVTGLVVSEPDIRDDRIQLRVEAESAFVNNQTFPTGGLILVEAPRSAEINYGDRIRATGALATPATWDTFSYADYLGRQGVFTLMRNAGVEVIGAGYGSPVWTLLLELKQIVRGEIAKALPEPSAGLLTGILLGDERGISPALAEDFQRVGASHIVAISGFNMVIVSAVVIAVLSSLFPGKSPWVTVSAITVIAVYSLFVGGSASIMRAALMSSLLIIGKQLNRRTFVPTSLAFAALLLSFGDPNVLLDVGFQLSFLAVLGLGLFADPLSRKFRSLLDRVLPAPAAGQFTFFSTSP